MVPNDFPFFLIYALFFLLCQLLSWVDSAYDEKRRNYTALRRNMQWANVRGQSTLKNRETPRREGGNFGIMRVIFD